MPNVIPRGLYAFRLGAWRSATSVFVKQGDGTWCEARFVYAFCNDDWVPIWSSTVPAPTTATATWAAADTSVTVDWTLPSPNTAQSWEVRRPDGSLVGSVAGSATSLKDNNPLPVVGSYTVKGTAAGGYESTPVSTNSLDLTLQPATATAVLSGTSIVVSWTPHATLGEPDSWSIYNITSGAWQTTGLAKTARSYTVTGLTPGQTWAFGVYPVLSGANGAGRSAASVGIPADVPTSVTLTALAVPNAGTLRLTWAAPASGAGNVTAYEVEYSTNGTTWTASSDDVTPSDWAAGEGTAGYMRVRALSPGGASAWVQKGPVTAATRPVASTPVSLSLTALSSPISTARLTWAAGASGATQYEVETSVNGSTWAASSDDTSPSDYLNTTAAQVWMRVRAFQSNTSYNGWSAWAQAGPVTMIHDVTPPAVPVVSTWEPQSSYGRMVVAGTQSASSDAVSLTIYYRVGTSGNWSQSWTGPKTPGAAFGPHVVGTFSAGQTIQVLVRAFDGAGNFTDAAVKSYALVASPRIIDAVDSATWRGSAWRTDGVAGSTGVMHGRTSSGENYGFWFYGETLQDFCSTHTVVSATLDYNRDGSSQGSSAAIQPGIWTHGAASQPATMPGLTNGPVLGSGVARSGTTGGSCTLSAAQIAALSSTAKGLGCYRQTSNSNDADAASFYMRLFPFQTNSGGKISGRVTLNHLG